MTRPPHGSPTLVLVSTALEERGIQDAGGLEIGSALCATCGFGPIAAAARTARLVAELAPSRVFLVGIAGTYDPERAPIGTALEFGAVAIDGVGAGLGERAISSAALGFGSADRLELGGGDPRDLLLTTCSASGTPADARLRRERFPAAACEDMEGFAVAQACALTSTPLRIVRGVSNVAGDRERGRWEIRGAIAAARERLLVALRSPAGGA